MRGYIYYTNNAQKKLSHEQLIEAIIQQTITGYMYMFIGHCVYNPIKRIQRFLDLAADVANFMD